MVRNSRALRSNRLRTFVLALAALALAGCLGPGAEEIPWQQRVQRGIELRGDTSRPAAERFALAEQEYRLALAELERKLGTEPVDTADVRELFNELESLLRTESRHEELPGIIEKRLAVLTELTGPENMLIATTYSNLAAAEEKLGNRSAAVAAYARAREMYARIGRQDSAEAMAGRIRDLGGKVTAVDSSTKSTVSRPPSDYDRLSLTRDVVERAVAFGRTAEVETTEFGSVDFGVNRFELAQKDCHVRLLTPFLHVARTARYHERKSEDLPQDELRRAAERPLEIHVTLNVAPEQLDEEVSTHLVGPRRSVDLSGEKMEASSCDDGAGRCVRTIAYRVYAHQLGDTRAFDIVLRSPSLGTETVHVDLANLW